MIYRVSIDKFLPFVMAACQGLPEEMAQAYIRQTLIDFCERTSLLKRHKVVKVPRGFDRFPIEPDNQEQIVRINHLVIDGHLHQGHQGYLHFHHFGRAFTIKDGFIVLSTPLESEKAIEVTYVAAPTREACEVDAVLYDDWQEAIEDGALARLLILPNYQFTQPNMAMFRTNAYAQWVQKARVRTLKKHHTGITYARGESFL